MKLESAFTTALLGGAALLLAGSSAVALDYNTGDVFLGFQQTGKATDYLVNLGNVSQFSHFDGASFTVNLGGAIGDDLTSAFGSTWYQQSNLFWSVSGTTFSNLGDPTTLYFTKARGSNINNPSSPWISNSNNGQADQVSYLRGLASAYVDFGTATENSTSATFQSTSLANSYASFTQGTSSDFQWGNIEGKFNASTSTANSVLDLYQITPSLDGTPATYLGKFTINNSGVVTFTAIPEPSAYGVVVGAGLAVLVIARRRRNFANPRPGAFIKSRYLSPTVSA